MENNDAQRINAANEEINVLLESGTTSALRKAAKIIAKHRLTIFGKALHEGLIKIAMNPKHWETQTEIIKVLGLIDYKPSFSDIMAICLANKEFDMVTCVSATSYVRLKRQNIADVQPVFELLKQNGYAVTCGALDALGYDRMMPQQDDVKSLIELCFDLRSPNPKGLTDPRYGLAAACAGWNAALVKNFLINCIQTGDAPVKYVAENALKGKYVKLR